VKRLLLLLGVLVGGAALLRYTPACAGDDPPAQPAPTPPEGPAKPTEPAKPAIPPPPPPPQVGPPGMVYVPADYTEMRIGTTPTAFYNLTKNRPEAVAQLRYETPQHVVKLKPYFIGAFEVTNAQYLVFVEQTAKTTYRTGSSSLANLQDIGSFFVHGDAASVDGQKDPLTWGQLYELNKDTLHAARPDLLKDKDGKDLPPKDVKRAFRFASLPADVELTVFRRRLPEDWFLTSNRLEDPAGADLPVRDVSYLDALAFCRWAGFHVPTEAEWEVAARGPELRTYPWGEDWVDVIDEAGNRTVEQRCNWLDVKTVNRLFEPSAMPVETLPDGKSWVGCWHMLGNVAEWTSSWFDAYPGFIKKAEVKKGRDRDQQHQRPEAWESYPGEFVKVIRGGSVADRERLVLRLPARNFIGAGSLAPPRPENHFKHVGFRCASYFFEPGLDRFEAAVLPLLKGKMLRREALADDRFAGAMAVHWVPKDTPVENHVFVTGASHAVLFTPLAALYPTEERPPARTPAEILAEAVGTEDKPLILGFLSTDVGIVGDLKDPKAPPVPPEPAVRRGQKRPPGKEPRVVPGTIPAGSYILGLNHKHVGFYKGNLDFVGWVKSPPTLDAPKFSTKEGPPLSTMSVEADADLVRCSFWIGLGGKGSEPQEGVRVSFSLPTETGALEKAGSWRESRAK
jgi:formylglycine-generating enzyme required for sulfatase activity